MDHFESGNLLLESKSGLHESVEGAVTVIDLTVACDLVAKNQQWSDSKIAKVENEYRTVLAQFALAFEGVGIASCLNSDVALLWQAHCADGKKFASDMHTVATALIRYRGKSLDEKFPAQTD